MPRAPVSPLAEPWQPSAAADVGLSATAQLMLFRPGLYSVSFNARQSVRTDIGLLLPCARFDPVQPIAPEDGRAFVSMAGEGGWVSRPGDKVFVLVAGGTARVILTVYKAGPDMPAPEIRIDNVTQDALAPGGRVEPPPPPPPRAIAPGEIAVELTVHSTGAGDIVGVPGEWAGVAGATMEGFTLAVAERGPEDALEYQAILGVDWDTPWQSGGEFCGSRGLSLALRGCRIRGSAALARTHACVYWGRFRGGEIAGPFRDGEACAAGSLELEALKVLLEERAPTLPHSPEIEPGGAPEAAMPRRRRKGG